MNQQPDLFPAPIASVAPASLEAFAKIQPTLTEREIEVFLKFWRYLELTGRQDATCGEVAESSGTLITSLRPRATGLVKKGWLEAGPIRDSRAQFEGRCHALRPILPREAVARACREVAAGETK